MQWISKHLSTYPCNLSSPFTLVAELALECAAHCQCDHDSSQNLLHYLFRQPAPRHALRWAAKGRDGLVPRRLRRAPGLRWPRDWRCLLGLWLRRAGSARCLCGCSVLPSMDRRAQRQLRPDSSKPDAVARAVVRLCLLAMVEEKINYILAVIQIALAGYMFSRLRINTR